MLEMRVEGHVRRVHALEVYGERIIVTGSWLKVARVEDEDWREGQLVRNPEQFATEIHEIFPAADVFTFCQKLPDAVPRYNYHLEWENLAVVHTRNSSEWWGKLTQVTRKNVRRALRRGLVVRSVECDDTLIRGIHAIYNEVPVRDGRPFVHFGKDVATIKREVSTMPDRSEFLAAFHDGELIGFIKLIHMGRLSSILHIVSKRSHYDKRPSNALIARAVEACQERGVEYLIYGHYDYGSRSNSTLTEFKRRNGFERLVVPRYFVPLTPRGRIALRLKLHHGAHLLPQWCIEPILRVRTQYYDRQLRRFLSEAGQPQQYEEM
jgi:hypothetical protein